jgi:cardiolipin synthase
MVSVGSANLDVRSFFLSFEANALIYDAVVAKAQREQFETDMTHSVTANKAYFLNLPAPVKFMMPLCQMFSPLL